MFVSGIMMGRLSFDLDDVVTKTTGGLIVLPKDHYLVSRKSRPSEAMHRIGKSACDQCSYCTEFCPRYLLGYEVMPHKVMRSLGFTLAGVGPLEPVGRALLRLRAVHAVRLPGGSLPEGSVRPVQGRHAGRRDQVRAAEDRSVVHPMKENRRVPLSQLRRRLKIEAYEGETPFAPSTTSRGSVRIKLSQHVGKPAKAGRQGGRQGRDAGRLSAGWTLRTWAPTFTASIAGTVKEVTDTFVEIEA